MYIDVIQVRCTTTQRATHGLHRIDDEAGLMPGACTSSVIRYLFLTYEPEESAEIRAVGCGARPWRRWNAGSEERPVR